MERVLILGVGGFVGKYLADEFIKNNYEVIGSDIQQSELLNIDCYQSDILNGECIKQIIDKVHPDIIVNLAAVSSVGQSWKSPQTTVSINVVGSLNILEAVRLSCPQCKVLFVGSSEEYGVYPRAIDECAALDASNPYGISKLMQERFAEIYRKNYGIKVYCARPFNHTGVGQKDTFVLPSFCKQVAGIEKSGKPGAIKVGNIQVKRDFSHVKDIVRAYRLIVEKGDCSQIYNVGSGTAYKLSDLLEYIISLSNQNILVEVDPEKLRPSDNPIICCDNSLIKKDLNWQAEFTVYDALNEMYNNYLDMMI